MRLLANLLIQILPGLTPGEFFTFGLLGVAAWAWARWILRNRRLPPDAFERSFKS